ncbi:M16 family metallopeptidase [Gloeocapsopsis dulcis]|uniref:Peptidase M16 n=1 Tax=Gloeocapsopsis dulcis AAB1 = 1H9 TaxID=1433147 RepID=A0A6N8FRH8_9CHRO|nr:pitrilysin family protein [Gloeocapsopsis dulcis]MUL35374.1 peptidase M16 [Gloeocapsopsis dulcis AAB1 = 1H9]WNN90424.1 pitrilysin family protein [Gloeocapsopsis dulcis]
MTSTVLIPRLHAPTLHRLPNGLTVIAEQMPIEAVNLSLWVNVGSAVESDAINGMAHFLEHMVFKGTQHLCSGEFERLIEERGAVTNAATSQDYTHYYITTAPKDFAQLAPLQIDVVQNCMIPDDGFERERLVVLEEIRRSDDNPRRRTFQRAMQTAFDRLPYRRPVIGSAEVISQLTPQQMRDFHQAWYQPRSITAVAVGNLPVEELIEVVTDSVQTPTSHLKPQEYRPATICESPFTEIIRHEYVDESLQQARLIMVWRVPGLMQIEQTYALDVLTAILGHGRTSRLVRELREEKGLVSHISVSNMTQQLQGTFYISAALPVENIPIVEAAIAQHIQIIQTQPVQESEIARIRTQVANRFIFGNETPSDRASLYGYYHSMVGDLEPAFEYPTKIQRVDATDILTAAQQHLSANAYGVVILKPA